MKNIKLKTTDAVKLYELMQRGLAYTDEHYKTYKSYQKLFNLVIKQLKEQGMFTDYIIYE
mgnify:CR=1 FL=1